MTELAPALIYALFLWWFSTGAILYVTSLPGAAARRWTGLGAGAMTVVALLALAALADDPSLPAAFLTFAAALGAWGGVETLFLAGLVTGPRRAPCPAGAGRWIRLRLATETILHHELALAGTGLAIVAATWGGVNALGWQTFALLWVLRLSAKLNLFLGVPVTNEELLPERLRHLASYFARRPINALFPLSVTAATVVTALLAARAVAPGTDAVEGTRLVLLATLLGLAVLEHWFMLLPLPTDVLWRWGLRPRAEASPLSPRLLTLVPPGQPLSFDRSEP